MALSSRTMHHTNAHQDKEQSGGSGATRSRVCPHWLKSSLTRWLTKSISNSGSIILMITFGYQIQKHSDPLVKLAEDAVDTFSRATLPAAFLVDTFPIRTKSGHLHDPRR